VQATQRAHRSYEAVATWRASSEGRALEQRKLNLKISGLGIKDFGTDEGFSPIDLVMRAKACSRSDAVAWLQERVQSDSVVVDFEALTGVKPKPAPEEQEPEPEYTGDGDPVPPASLGEPWYFGDPVPAQKPMLVPNLIPFKGWGYLGGQWGTFKTFITNDLAIAVASGGAFAGQQVTVAGAVVQIELEGSHSELRLHAAAAARGVASQKLPIVQLRVEPPKIMDNGRPNKAVWQKWSNDLAAYARAFAKARGVELALITIDPQNSIAGFRDEQSSAEGQLVSDAWKGLSAKAGCFALITDHLGKDADAGLRGTSTKETNPLVILSTGATRKDTYEPRQLEVRKMRNGRAGVAVIFQMEDMEITVNHVVENEDGTKVIEPHTGKTLVVKWGSDLRPVGVTGNEDARDAPQQRRALAILNDLINGAVTGVVLPPECEAPAGLRGTKLETWRLRLIHKMVFDNKNTSAQDRPAGSQGD